MTLRIFFRLQALRAVPHLPVALSGFSTASQLGNFEIIRMVSSQEISWPGNISEARGGTGITEVGTFQIQAVQGYHGLWLPFRPVNPWFSE